MSKSLRSFALTYRGLSGLLVQSAALCNRLGLWMPYQPLPEARIRVSPDRADLTLDRWAKIEPTLPPGPLSVLEIGANIGFFTVRLAHRGCFVTSLDNSFYSAVLHHVKTRLRLSNIATTDMLLTPSNVHTLPSYDCTIFLSVFHHWCVAYGSDAALAMLETVFARTKRVLYFETGQPDTTGARFQARLPAMSPTPLAWLQSHFTKLGAVEVRELGYFRGRHLVAAFK